MVTENDFLIPVYPEVLQQVDVVRARFVLEFLSPCKLQPADFLGLGRLLRLAGRTFIDSSDDVALRQWRALFQPTLSEDPVARRKFQKPAPAYVVSMPVMQLELFDAGDQLGLEVLFIGTGVPLIHEFLRSLIHLGALGLAAGEGRFEVAGLYCHVSDGSEALVWRQSDALDALSISVQPLQWLLAEEPIPAQLCLRFATPTRLLVSGKPLRKPDFKQVFPFMLRRVTSMLHAHCGVEAFEDPMPLLKKMHAIDMPGSKLRWHDWRTLPGRQGLTVGGFLGDLHLSGSAIEEVFWVLSVASLLGIGKDATYGAGRFDIVF